MYLLIYFRDDVWLLRSESGSGVLSASVLLVIGDDEERLHLRRALAGEGWRVIPAGSGSQARQMASREDFEIAVVDNRLPDERGFQVISAVQKPGVSTVARSVA